MQGFIETEIGWIPEDWEFIESGSEIPKVCEVLRNGLTDNQDKFSGKYEVCRIETMGAGYIDEEIVQLITTISNEKPDVRNFIKTPGKKVALE